ncbi:MAG: hypothetical protein Q8R76_01190 [Candidatus Omnitrophota bacterium]|nr:hypothetical protein [Candidatus Omnitrophota bacterium]
MKKNKNIERNEKNRKQAAQAPSLEDWEGGGSRPQEENEDSEIENREVTPSLKARNKKRPGKAA